ncbi:MAG TPA: tRNA (cytidine(34)-2'-O)-methyltransferase [Methylocystis sp.]|nr:tRNA (cytidine(34)-2'-O)-methyltransferase [Methylocystis sp.]
MTTPADPRLALALYQPDIAQNAGTILRTCACLGFEALLIGPAGFATDDKRMRRAGMDYLDQVALIRLASFDAFESWRSSLPQRRRLVLLSTKAESSYIDFSFEPGDILMLGRESAGVPAEVAARADFAIKIPMRPGLRSLNVAVAGAIVAGEALRQLRQKG